MDESWIYSYIYFYTSVVLFRFKILVVESFFLGSVGGLGAVTWGRRNNFPSSILSC